MHFNSDEHQDQFAPITGQHRFRIEAVQNDFTKVGGYPVLVFTLKLIEGPHKNRTHFDRFICEHANPDTVRIAMGKLSSLSRAVGLPRWNSEHELVGRVGEAVFGPQKNDPAFTEVKRYIVESESKGAPVSNPVKSAAAKSYEAQTPLGNLPPAPHPAESYSDDDVPF